MRGECSGVSLGFKDVLDPMITLLSSCPAAHRQSTSGNLTHARRLDPHAQSAKPARCVCSVRYAVLIVGTVLKYMRRCPMGDGSCLTAACAYASCRNQSGQLVLGDIITGIDGRAVKSQKDLFEILDDCKASKRALRDRVKFKANPQADCAGKLLC